MNEHKKIDALDDLITGDMARKKREELGKNQTDFWHRLGVPQSGASRYETGRKIPKPVQNLLRVVYFTTENQAGRVLAEWRK